MRLNVIASAVLLITAVSPGGALDRPPPGPLAQTSAQGLATPAGTAVLTGTLTTGTPPQPVRRATVRISGGGPSARVVGTDDHGRFTFAALPAGSYSLSATKPGFVTVFHGERRPGSGPGDPVAVTVGQRIEVSLRMLPGAAITGTITDMRGSPMSSVQVLAVEVRAGGATGVAPARATTDDRGTYRIFGLAPGEYVVAATPRFGAGRGMAQDVIGVTDDEVQWARSQSASTAITAPRTGAALPPPGRPVVYAPVYFPGSTDAAAASTVAVDAGEERSGVGFSTRIVATAVISGTLVDQNGQPLTSGSVTILPRWTGQPSLADALIAAGALVMPRATVSPPNFSLSSVTPGDYTLVARSGFSGRGAAAAAAMVTADPTLWSLTDVTVDGRDQTGLVIRLQPGTRISGTIAFETTTLTPPGDLSKLDLQMAATRAVVGAPAAPRAIIDTAGKFHFVSVVPGTYALRATPPVTAASARWALKSAMLEGRDIADGLMDVKPGQDLNGVVVTFTDRVSEIAGTFVDASGRPVTRYSIIAFTVDRSLWVANARRIQATQPATDGSFRIVGLPAGEYALAAAEDIAASDLADPAFLAQLLQASVKVTLAHGQKKTQNLRVGSGSSASRR